MQTEPTKITNIILIQGGVIHSSGMIPNIATFKAIGDAKETFVEVVSIEVAMRQFKFHVLLDSAVTRDVYPYTDGIALRSYDSSEECMLVEQVDHFEFTTRNGLHDYDNYIYRVAPGVMLRSVGNREFDDWAPLDVFSGIYNASNSEYNRELMQRTLHALTTPKPRKEAS